MNHVAKAWALALCATLPVACSETRDSKPVVNRTVIESGWGSGAGELGRVVGNEAASPGPMSFAVDSASTVHVLDQVNRRIQKFAYGAALDSVVTADRPFSDIELDGKGGYALLDPYREPAVVFVDAKGVVSSEISLAIADIPEPSQVTTLTRHADGFYVVVAGEYLVRVADQNRAAVEPSVVPGQALIANAAIKAEVRQGKELALHLILAPGTPPTKLTDLPLAGASASVTLLAPAPNAGVFLGVRGFGSSSSHTLYELGSDGQEQRRVTLPNAAIDPVEVTRSVRLGEDGKVYALRMSEDVFAIEEVTP